MKSYLFLIVSAFMGHAAFANDVNVNLNSRVNYKYKSKDNSPGTSAFDIDYLKLGTGGIITPTLKYNLLLDMLEVTSSADKVDGTNNFIEEAFVVKKLTDSTSLNIGKQGVYIGGIEHSISGMDIYTSSYFSDKAPDNQVGITLIHEFSDQTFYLQTTNGNKDSSANPASRNSQSKLSYALGFEGSFMGGIIKPILGYTIIPKSSGTDRNFKGDDLYSAAGVRISALNNIIFELDYGIFNAKNKGSAREDEKTISLTGVARFTQEHFSPFIKIINDETKSNSTRSTTRTAFDIGIEYKELKDDSYNYHLVYSTAIKKDYSVTPIKKETPQTIVLGLKFDAAILK